MSYIENFSKEIKKLALEDTDDSKYLAFGNKYFEIIPIIRGQDFSKTVVQVKRFENDLLMECRNKIESKCAQDEMSIHNISDMKQKMKKISKEVQIKRKKIKKLNEMQQLNESNKLMKEIHKRKVFEMIREEREFLKDHNQRKEAFERILNKMNNLIIEMDKMALENAIQMEEIVPTPRKKTSSRKYREELLTSTI